MKEKPTCKKCKRICKLCEHIIEEENSGFIEYKCSKFKEEKIDCVDGRTYNHYPFCSDINEDGNCSGYKLNKPVADKLKLIEMLEKRQKKIDEMMGLYHTEETVEEMLIKNLINSIENGTPDESGDFYTSYKDGDIFSTRYEKKEKKPKEYVR